MSWANCTNCGREVHWRATRGTRLSDIRCPDCGSGLRGKTAGQTSKTAGKRYGRCVLCGRKRLESKLYALPRPAEPLFEKVGELPAGSTVCRSYHSFRCDKSINISGYAPAEIAVSVEEPHD